MKTKQKYSDIFHNTNRIMDEEIRILSLKFTDKLMLMDIKHLVGSILRSDYLVYRNSNKNKIIYYFKFETNHWFSKTPLSKVNKQYIYYIIMFNQFW